jgi:hypothetical protein
MALNWGCGLLDSTGMMTQLHRVVFYGNHLQSVRHLGAVMGFSVLAEG